MPKYLIHAAGGGAVPVPARLVRSALALGIALALPAGAIHAQEQGEPVDSAATTDTATELDAVQVTGIRVLTPRPGVIRGVAIVANNSDEILAVGATAAGGTAGVAEGLTTLLQQLPPGTGARNLELTRYVIGILHLERKLSRRQDLLRRIRSPKD